jgi:hypothetical protein
MKNVVAQKFKEINHDRVHKKLEKEFECPRI